MSNGRGSIAVLVLAILSSAQLIIVVSLYKGQFQLDHCRAGHFRYFLIFSQIKNDFLHFLSS